MNVLDRMGINEVYEYGEKVGHLLKRKRHGEELTKEELLVLADAADIEYDIAGRHEAIAKIAADATMKSLSGEAFTDKEIKATKVMSFMRGRTNGLRD